MMTSNALLPVILIISQPRSSDTVSGAGWREVPKSKVMFSAAAHAEPLTSMMAHVPTAQGTRVWAMLAGLFSDVVTRFQRGLIRFPLV